MPTDRSSPVLPRPALLVAGSALALAFLGPDRSDLVLAMLPWTLWYIGLLLLWMRHREWLGRTGVLLGGALAVRILFLITLPDLSDDLYRYVWDGLLTVEGIRPYSFVPSDVALAHLHGLDLYGAMNSPDYHSIYPPLSQWVFLPAGLAYEAWGWPAAAWVVKAGFLLLESVGVLLLHRTLLRLDRPVGALALYAWNPLIVVAIAGGGHTEGGMVLGIGLLLYGLSRRPSPAASWLAWSGWGLATLAKGLPLLLAPLLWRGLCADGSWRRQLPALLSVMAGMVLLSLPFLRVGDLAGVAASVRLYTQLFEFNAGLYYLLQWLLEAVAGVGTGRLGSLMGLVALATSGWIVLRHPAGRTRDLARGGLLVFSVYLVCATTVHPWYLVWVLVFMPFSTTLRAAWLWAGAAALPTYLTYTGIPHMPLVALFWGGWAILALHEGRERVLSPLRTLAARRKAGWIAPFAPGRSILDVGGAEGAVARHLASFASVPGAAENPESSETTRFAEAVGSTETRTRLVIVADPMRTGGRRDPRVARIRAIGEDLPLRNRAVDSVVLSFVLHHAADPEQVLTQALRVARRRVVILESTPETALGTRILRPLDAWVNARRGDGSMGRGRIAIRYRTGAEWETLARTLGARIVLSDHPGRIGHPVTRLVLEPRSDQACEPLEKLGP